MVPLKTEIERGLSKYRYHCTYIAVKEVRIIVRVAARGKYAITYVFVVVKRVEHIIRQAGEEVDDEPGLEVVHPDHFRVRHDLAARTHERRVEVEDNVDEEDDVNYGVDHQQRDVLGGLVLEGYVVRDHDGRVEGETQDDPVPDGLEGAVVEEDVGRRLRCLLAVLRHHVGAQTHHLVADDTNRIEQDKMDMRLYLYRL